MIRLLCRNRVADYKTWWEVFSSHARAHREAGLVLEHVWRSQEDPNNVFFVFEVVDSDRARSFINAPEAQEAAGESNVLDSDYHLVESADGY